MKTKQNKTKQNKNGGTPYDGDRVSRQSSKVRGWLPPQNILSHHFEKYLHGMVLKLSGHVRNTISLLHKQRKKKRVKPRYLKLFLAKKWMFLQFGSIFTENPLFESGHV